MPVPHQSQPDHGLGPGFHLRETASYLNGLPPDLFGMDIQTPAFHTDQTFKPSLISGLDEWGEDAVLSQVLAASQQEYLDSLKKREGEGGEQKGEEGSSNT